MKPMSSTTSIMKSEDMSGILTNFNQQQEMEDYQIPDEQSIGVRMQSM